MRAGIRAPARPSFVMRADREGIMPIRLIALDMDGTTLRNDHFTVSRRNRRAIRDALRAGVLVVPATGRYFRGIPSSVLGIPGIRYAISSNGACVTDIAAGKALFKNMVPPSLSAEILSAAAELGVYAEVYAGGRAYMQRGTSPYLARQSLAFRFIALFWRREKVDHLAEFIRSSGAEVEKIELLPENARQAERMAQKLKGMPLSVTTSGMNSVEVTNLGAGKGKALELLCGRLGMRREDVMAVGDNYNDLDMLAWAGTGVCVENGDAGVRRAADFVTARSDRDGVACAIERFALPRAQGG